MFSLIKSLFSSAPDKILDMASGVGNFIDEQQFTAEEKAEYNKKQLELFIKWQEATQGQNLARRLISVTIIAVFCTVFLTCVGLSIAGMKSEVTQVIEVAKAFSFGDITLAIIAFYFIKGGVDKFKK